MHPQNANWPLFMIIANVAFFHKLNSFNAVVARKVMK